MRIALLQPTFWPEVRRGSERLVHDLALYLAGRGYDVTLLTSHRGLPSTEYDSRLRVIRRWRPPERPPLTWYEHHVANIPGVVWHLCRGEYDVAHAFFSAEGWAALQARRLGGPPVAFSFHGIPARSHLVRRRYRLAMIEALAHHAEVVSVLSEAAAQRFRVYFRRDPLILPGGVLTDDFSSSRPRARHPTLICAASLGDARKRADVLFSAFDLLRERRPDARLRVVRTRDPVMSGQPPSLPEGAAWIDADHTPELADALASSWASVLPAVDEAFGLVLVESLAAGTPVIAARSGACVEIVDDERIGRLFTPDDPQDLARCMDEALTLTEDRLTSDRCRRRAAAYDWSRVGGLYEALYAALAHRSREHGGVRGAGSARDETGQQSPP
jgi:glycosyltransferase involved in cell wall biosynthesis